MSAASPAPAGRGRRRGLGASGAQVGAQVGDIRVGVDLASVGEVQASLARFGPRYLRRVFTDKEISESKDGTGVPADRLAARFAVKEAVMKVLGTRDRAVPWTDIELGSNADGRRCVVLRGSASELAREAGIDHLAVSVTHEAGMAAAVVVAAGAGS